MAPPTDPQPKQGSELARSETTSTGSRQDGLRGQLQNAQERFSGLTPRNRLILIGTLATLTAGILLWFMVTRAPQMQLLFSDLSPDDSGRIIEHLGGLQVPYEMQDQGDNNSCSCGPSS